MKIQSSKKWSYGIVPLSSRTNKTGACDKCEDRFKKKIVMLINVMVNFLKGKNFRGNLNKAISLAEDDVTSPLTFMLFYIMDSTSWFYWTYIQLPQLWISLLSRKSQCLWFCWWPESYINPSRSNPGRREQIKFFIFTLLCGA